MCIRDREYGVRCQLSLEERMGCGLGACLVCNCKVRAQSEQGWQYKLSLIHI